MTGLRNGLSNAFRALIALKMVIGAAVGTGGLGWFVMAEKQNLEIPSVFAGIVAIMAIGLIFEGLFAVIEPARCGVGACCTRRNAGWA